MINSVLSNPSALLQFFGLSAGFLATLYALYTKDSELRQSRRELFHVLVLVLTAFMLQCVVWVLVTLHLLPPSVSAYLSLTAMSAYTIAVLLFFFSVVVRSYVRIQKFKDPSIFGIWKHIPVVREIRRRRSRKTSQRYETNKVSRAGVERYKMLQHVTAPETIADHELQGLSALLFYKRVGCWADFVSHLVKEHAKNGETVTYVACRRHPSTVISWLESAGLKHGQEPLADRLVLVDAFTQLFGGDDEVFHKYLHEKEEDKYCIVPARTLPGIHTGTARAFGIFKKASKSSRAPGTVIYDGLSVLRHHEAEDQIARFITHLVEAERTYGMITFIAEPSVEAESAPCVVAKSCVDFVRTLAKCDKGRFDFLCE